MILLLLRTVRELESLHIGSHGNREQVCKILWSH